AGEYPFHVTVTEPDGASVSGSESIAGNHFEASLLASIGALFAPVVADFNDDGELDVAVGQSNLGANKAFITFGGVDFTFAPTQVVDIPTRFQAAAAGDFDNDGIVDLVVAGQIDVPGTESLSVVFGSRDGSLRVGSSTTPLSPYPPGSIATLDFDSDGNLDVVVGYGCGSLGCGAFIEVFRGLGDGTFETAGIHTAFLGSIVATGDLNGDGHPDIVVGSPLNISLLILLGDGAGFSGPPTSVPLPGTTNSLAIADMNEDGVLDIVVGVGHLVVLTGAGDGTFTSVSHPAATTIYRIAVVDLNGDGRPDVVASDIDTTITVLLAEADGGFVTAQTMIGSQAREVLIGDFNRDGQFDVAIVGNSAVLRIYPGRGDGMVNVAQTIPSPTLQRDVLAADVNHDGFLDAVSVANGIGIGGILVSLGRGDGTFDTAPQLPLGTRATDPKPSAVAIADLNGDGRTEVLVGVPGGLAVFARNTDGSYAQSRVYPLTQSPFDMATGDLNGDGRTDIVAAISLGDFVPGNVAILLNAGDGTFAAAQYLTTGEEAGSLVLRDLNMDGSVDIAVEVTGPFDNASRTFPNSGIEVFHGRGDGTFLPGVLVRAGVSRNSQGTRGTIAAGDVDGDSIVDLVMAANGSTFTDPANPSAPPVRSHDGLYILLGNADGTYRPGQRYLNEPDRTLPSVQSATLGDFDGDGKLDVATSRTFFSGDRPDDVLVLLGNGDGTFGTETAYDAGLSATQLLSGDFDGDGSTDLVTAEPSVGGAGISLLLNQGDGTFGPAVSYFAGGGSWGIALGDLDSDGHLDVATANFDSGTVGLLLGRGDGTLIASRLSDALAGLLWSIIPGDLNRDGKLDLVVASSHSDYVDVLIGRGDGSFDAMPPVAIPNQTVASVVAPRDMAIADNNGDGEDELLVAAAVTGTIATVPILADGSLGTPVLRTQSVGSRFAFGDFNGDGRIDAAAVKTISFVGSGRFTNEVEVLLAQTDQTFIAGAAQPTGTGASGVVAADVNHDGRLDLVIANAGDLAEGGTVNGGVVVLLGVGDGTFEAPVVYRPNESFGAIDVADLNGDGSLDLMLVRGDPLFGSERDISVMYNQGDGTFGPPEILDANSPYVLAAITAGDFAGDGLPDILVGSELFAQHVRVIRNVPLVTGAVVTDAPIDVSAANLMVRAAESFTAAIGSFDDANPLSIPENFISTIEWGDGQTSPGIVEELPDGQYQVTGTHTYAVAGLFATRITVVETDAGTHFATGQIQVASTDGNTPPVAVNDTAVTNENTAVVVAVLANDQDVDGSLNAASVLVVAQPAHGTATVSAATGEITYTPATDFVGDDRFSYTVADDKGAVSNEATVSVTVDDRVPFILATDGQIVTFPGTPNDAVALRFTWTFDGSKRKDEVWAFAVDDEQGTVAGVSPGHPDYAATVIEQADWWLVFQHASSVGATRDLILPGGTRLAFFVIQDDEINDPEDHKDGKDKDHKDKSDDWCGDKPLAFFSLDAANPEGRDHLHDQQFAPDVLEHAWETGDRPDKVDFDDVVYSIKLVDISNPPTMYTPPDPRPPFMPYRLGDVEDLELTGLDPSQEDLWYKFETTHEGLLSIQVVYDGPHYGVGLELYDQRYEGDHDVRPVTTGRIVDGGQRIDWPTLDNRKYYVRLTGDATEVGLRLVNLVASVGTHVTVHGTAGDDRLVFDASVGHKITINGMDYTFTAVEAASFSFKGSAGTDNVRFVGATGPDSATIHPTFGTFSGQGYSLAATDIEWVDYDGGQGEDTVTIWGSNGHNQYTANPGSGEMTGDGVSISVTAETIYARGNGGSDTVYFTDSEGDDLLEYYPRWAIMSGEGYFNQVNAFKVMYADAERGAGGTDTVIFRGTSANDQLRVTEKS
ncbi:MAG: cadherin-like domain-containing protein, partial [Rhodopirellula sp.]|nr:cadherin-like domain-containing protein [Rhodopirellula sp.]